MQISIRTRNVDLDSVARQEIERRVEFALDRFAGRVGTVEVSIEDVNGPRGGVDKSVHVRAELPECGDLRIGEEHQSTMAAVSAACDRLRKLVAARTEIRRTRETVRVAAAMAAFHGPDAA